MLPQDFVSDLDKIGQDLNQIKSNLEDGFKIFSKYLCGFNEDICSKANLNLQELISGGHSFMKGIDNLVDLKKEYQDVRSQSLQPATVSLHLDKILQHLKMLQSHYEDGTNVFRNTYFTLEKQPHNLIHLDLQHLNHGLDIFQKGSGVICSLQIYIESLQSKLSPSQDHDSVSPRKMNGRIDKKILSNPEVTSDSFNEDETSDKDSDFEYPRKNKKENKVLPVKFKFEESNEQSVEYNISMMPPDDTEIKIESDLDDMSKDFSATSSSDQIDGLKVKKKRLKKLQRKKDGVERPFNCTICNASFARKDTLISHIRSHTGEKPFTCQFCSKSFKRKDGLKDHIKGHTGEKPHECSFCNKSFIRKDKLANHMRTHTGEKPFECDICHVSFGRRDKLNAHKKSHFETDF